MNDYEKRLPGEAITLQNRKESEEQVDKRKRYNQILEIMYEQKDTPLTAKEIADIMFKRHLIPTNERNFTAPRLNELSKVRKVEPVGKKVCKWTGRNVSAYKIIV